MLGLIARFLPSLIPAFTALLNPWIILALVAAFALAGLKGYQLGAAKLDTYRAEQMAEETRLYMKRVEITERVVTKYVTKIVPKTQIVTETVEREVIRYAESNPGYCLDPEWGRLHDAAATNTVPNATGSPDGAARTPPTAAEAVATVTENYARAHRTADKLEALQEWVRAQAGVK